MSADVPRPIAAVLPASSAIPMREPAVAVQGLTVSVRQAAVDVIVDVSLAIGAGEIVGLVGESGSGKSTLALALLWHAGRGLAISGGDVRLDGRSLRAMPETERRRRRGRDASYVPQDPGRALNPSLRIGQQLREMLQVHGAPEPQVRLREVLTEVGLPSSLEFLARFPHQLSGGQQQRVALAMAFACRPSLVVLDEPTTGLDTQTQSLVLATIREMCRRYDAAALYVSHDLAVVASIADRIAVLYAGRIVELAPARDLVVASLHPYTTGLLAAAPDPLLPRALTGMAGQAPSPIDRPAGCTFAPRCGLAEPRCWAREPDLAEPAPGRQVRCVRAGEATLPHASKPVATGVGHAGPALAVHDLNAWFGSRLVLHGISLDVPAGSCVAIVGESGSGKTTLARCIAGMHPAFRGAITLAGSPVPHAARARPRAAREAIQYVFQNPYAALNPRRTIAEILAQWIAVLGDPSDAERRASKVLASVGLEEDILSRYPDELSGGQQQRVALARALVSSPTFLICDEVTSALDVSVQASILALLGQLRRERGLALLFITHNLALVRSIADEVVVVRAGQIVEAGNTEAIFTAPAHEYTRDLLRLTPSLRCVTP